MSWKRTAHDAAGAERLAGQMSRDTPRPPHVTAREYASNGQYRTTVRGLATLTDAGSPSNTHHHRSRPLSAAAGRDFSIPKRTVRNAPQRSFATTRFTRMLTTFALTRADAKP